MHTIHFFLLQDRSQLASVSQQSQRSSRSAQVDGIPSPVADALIQRDDTDINAFLPEAFGQSALLSEDHERLDLIADVGENVKQGYLSAAPFGGVIDISNF
ncbi:hypothetical protein D3C73_1339310 [compost metagenome]